MPPYGVACAFPDTPYTSPPQGDGMDGVVVGERQLPQLGELLPGILDAALPDFSMPPNHQWMRALHELWGDTWVPVVHLTDKANDAEERRIGLDAQQLQILDFAGQSARALVQGSAGSGKTIVARELCRRRAEGGERVQFFCFTDALAKAVARQLGTKDGEGALSVAPVRRYAARLLRGEGTRAQTEDPDFWANVSFEAAATALPPENERPDLIVVDEAQDLDESDWALVEELSKGKALWIFWDPAQGFWKDRTVPTSLQDGMAKLSLLRQYRNTGPIWRFAEGYLGGAEPTRDPLPDGDPVHLVASSAEGLEKAVAHRLSELRKAGARPQDIAVLTLAGQTVSTLWGKGKLGSHAVRLADDPEAPSGIICDTFLRFKGLERPYVIVTEVGRGQGRSYDTRMHIAATRATVGLTVVAADTAITEDRRLSALDKPT